MLESFRSQEKHHQEDKKDIADVVLYLTHKAFLEMGIGFDSTLPLTKSERLFQLFVPNSLTFFNSIGVIV